MDLTSIRKSLVVALDNMLRCRYDETQLLPLLILFVRSLLLLVVYICVSSYSSSLSCVLIDLTVMVLAMASLM